MFNTSGFVKANSFINGDHLYQCKVSSTKINLGVFDVTNSAMVKEFQNENPGEIPFKNTDLFLEKSGFVESVRTIDNDRAILRKLSNKPLALSVSVIGDKTEVKIGSFNETSTPMGGFGVSGIILSYSITSTKESYFKTYLNTETHERIPGQGFIQSALDKFASYTPDSNGAQLVFSWNGSLYGGSYNWEVDTYSVNPL